MAPASCALAHARAPAPPPLPPDVETSTSVLRRSRPTSCGRLGCDESDSVDGTRVRKIRASSSSAAVPDRSASPGESSASRCASTTMRRLESPGRTPTTVSSSVSPSTVRPLVRVVETWNPAARKTWPTRSPSAVSPLDPGRRCGNASPSCTSESRIVALPYARLGSNASATARVRAGDGRPASEKATTNSASRAGKNAAR